MHITTYCTYLKFLPIKICLLSQNGCLIKFPQQCCQKNEHIV